MTSKITRRDFLNGAAYTVASAGLAATARAQEPGAAMYPPRLDGFRGGRFEDIKAAHAVRDGQRYEIDRYVVSETVDTVIVGAGIGGLAAAYFLRKRAPRGQVLILDNNDDFGGHARRNEFEVDGRLLIGYGGSESIEAPAALWSPEARTLLRELGVDLKRFRMALDEQLYPSLGLSTGLLMRREAFGVDKLVTGDPLRMLPNDVSAALYHGRPIERFAADCPLTDRQREGLVALFTEKRNPFPGRSPADIRKALAGVSYADFLVKYWGIDSTVLKMFLGRTRDLFALEADKVSAPEAADSGFPGFQGLGLNPSEENLETYIYHFPDGNASLARLMVRRLIPGVAPGHSMEDIVTAKFNYEKLDQSGAPVRLRLTSTVVNLQNKDGHVDVLYSRDGEIRRVRCRDVIYTGYESMLPYVCNELQPDQRSADAGNVKLPLVYVNVALRNWRAWAKCGVHTVINPSGFYSTMKLDLPISLGSYRFAKTPDDPIVVHLVHIPQPPSPIADCRASLRAARAVLYQRPFTDFEAEVRDELGRSLASSGFDADRDIAAITVNRWGHGYAFDSNAVTDPGAPPHQIAVSRRAVGRISIAGSDAAWDAFAHSAIDQSHRAVSEVISRMTTTADDAHHLPG